ncbi:MAG: phage tail tube protein [Pseudomonadota bacterium]
MGTRITSRGLLDAGSLGRLPTKSGATLKMGNPTREPQMGDEGVIGYTEEYDNAPGLTVTIAHVESTDEANLKDFAGENLTYHLNSGKVYTLVNAWVINSLELAVNDGELEVQFGCDEVIPQ